MLVRGGEEFLLFDPEVGYACTIYRATHADRWFEKLEPYTFTVRYIRGHDNQAADALSRTPQFYVSAVEFTAPTPDLDPTIFAQAAQDDYDYLTIAQDPLAQA